MPEPLRWQIGTIAAIRPESDRLKTFTLALPDWRAHRPGQHYDIRLTAEDGYQAQRSYSIASPPSHAGEIDLGIERVPDGEVSGYFHDVAVTGDRVEVRGPVGGYFVWTPELGGPLLLVGGGSGVVPLMAMLRARAETRDGPPTTLLYSSRTIADVIYREELDRLAAADSGIRVALALTREQPPGWTGYSRRIDTAMLGGVLAGLPANPLVYICGPTLMVESASAALTGLGIEAARVRTERFGPTS